MPDSMVFIHIGWQKWSRSLAQYKSHLCGVVPILALELRRRVATLALEFHKLP